MSDSPEEVAAMMRAWKANDMEAVRVAVVRLVRDAARTTFKGRPDIVPWNEIIEHALGELATEETDGDYASNATVLDQILKDESEMTP